MRVYNLMLGANLLPINVLEGLSTSIGKVFDHYKLKLQSLFDTIINKTSFRWACYLVIP
jgi:hypothetical protein